MARPLPLYNAFNNNNRRLVTLAEHTSDRKMRSMCNAFAGNVLNKAQLQACSSYAYNVAREISRRDALYKVSGQTLWSICLLAYNHT